MQLPKIKHVFAFLTLLYSQLIFAAAPTGSPSISAPGRAISGAGFNISFSTVFGATSYRLYENGSHLTTRTSSPIFRNLKAHGVYNYTVRACNSSGCGPNSNKVFVSVGAKPSAPSISAPSRSESGQLFNISFGGVSGATSYKLFENGSHLTTRSSGPIGRRLYAEGTYSFNVQACNSFGCSGSSNTASTTIYLPNKAPTANNSSVSVNEDASVSISLSASDPDGDSLSYSISSGPSKGSLSGSGSRYTYRPNANVSGSDSFAFTVSDGKASGSASVSISIRAVNDSPEIRGLTQNLSMDEDTSMTLSINQVNVFDPDNASHSLQVLAGSNYSYSGNRITPKKDFYGQLNVNIRVSDGSATSATYAAPVTVNNTYDAPRIVAQSNLSVNEDESLSLTANAFTIREGSGSNFNLLIAGGPNYTVSGNSIRPIANFYGSLNVAVRVSDDTGTGAAYSASVTVVAKNDLPTGEVDTVQSMENGLITGRCKDDDTDNTAHAPKVRVWLDANGNGGIGDAGDKSLGEASCDKSNGGKFKFSIPEEYKGKAANNYRVIALDFKPGGQFAGYGDLGYHKIRYNAPPTVAMRTSGTVDLPASGFIEIKALAEDHDEDDLAGISKVKFYVEGDYVGRGSKIGTNLYGFNWTVSGKGVYKIKAVAEDIDKAVVVSAEASLTVTGVNAAPTVSIDKRSFYQSTQAVVQFQAGEKLLINASDDQSVTSVAVKIGSVTSDAVDKGGVWELDLDKFQLADGYYEPIVTAKDQEGKSTVIGDSKENKIRLNVCKAEKRSGEVEPEEFGAKGGNTDDSDAFIALSKCLNNSANIRIKLGKYNEYSNAEYCINQPITLSTTADLTIEGNKTTLKQCKLFTKPGMDLSTYKQSSGPLFEEFVEIASLITVKNSNNVRIDQLHGSFVPEKYAGEWWALWHASDWSYPVKNDPAVIKERFQILRQDAFIRFENVQYLSINDMHIKDFVKGLYLSKPGAYELGKIDFDGIIENSDKVVAINKNTQAPLTTVNFTKDTIDPKFHDFRYTDVEQVGSKLNVTIQKLKDRNINKGVKRWHNGANWNSGIYIFGNGASCANGACVRNISDVTAKNSGPAINTGDTHQGAKIDTVTCGNSNQIHWDNCVYLSSQYSSQVKNVTAYNLFGAVVKARGANVVFDGVHGHNANIAVSLQTGLHAETCRHNGQKKCGDLDNAVVKNVDVKDVRHSVVHIQKQKGVLDSDLIKVTMDGNYAPAKRNTSTNDMFCAEPINLKFGPGFNKSTSQLRITTHCRVSQ